MKQIMFCLFAILVAQSFAQNLDSFTNLYLSSIDEYGPQTGVNHNPAAFAPNVDFRSSYEEYLTGTSLKRSSGGSNTMLPSTSSILRGKIIARVYNPIIALYENVSTFFNISGSALAIDLKGNVIVELYQGYQNKTAGILYNNQTLHQGFSTGKALGAAAITWAISQELTDWKRTMCSHDSEFCKNGKENITIGQIFAHMACLMYFPEPVADSKNFTAVDLLIQNSTPNCISFNQSFVGKVATYHVSSWGLLTDYAIRKITGRTVEQLMNDEFFSKIPRSEMIVSPGPEYTSRIVKLESPDGAALFDNFRNQFCFLASLGLGEPFLTACKALSLLPQLLNPLDSNDEAKRGAIYAPGDSEFSTPVTMARLYSILVNPDTFNALGLEKKEIKKATTDAYNGPDALNPATTTSFTQAGWSHPGVGNDEFSEISSSFGRDGLGGPCCYALKRLKAGICFYISDINGFGGLDNPATYAMIKGVEDILLDSYLDD
jgi:hypothetical protein